MRREIPMWVGVTYVIYCVAWMFFTIGVTSYAVFVLGHSGWWFALAVFLLCGTYRPGRWAEVVTGDTGPTWKDCNAAQRQ